MCSVREVPVKRQIKVWLAAVLLSIPSLGKAQGVSAFDPGQRIRLVQGGRLYTVGRFAAIRQDSISLVTSGNQVVTVPLQTVIRVEVSRGVRARTGTGAVTGFAVGAGTGLVAAVLMDLLVRELTSTFGAGERGFAADEYLSLSVSTGAAGAILGTLIGSAVRRESWRPVPVVRAAGR
jgi:hypothetical protein